MSITVENDTIQCGMVSRAARIIATDEKAGKLAVVRKQRTRGAHDYVEFFNILSGWSATPELTICTENGSIENAIFVANGELMTCHANGSICFIDPHDHRRVKRIQIAASTIWAACDHPGTEVERSRVALISHSSILYFFDVLNKTIISSVSLGVDSRLFDVASNGELVAIGAIDGIMIVGDGKVQRTLKLDRENRRDPTIAWSVLFWKPDILACGDSRGSVTIWQPQTGALIQTVSCLQSHVLTMCIAENVLNVAGIDPRITSIDRMTTGEYNVVRRRNGPVRDVRSLAVYENRVYAAGEDFDIFVGTNGCQKLRMKWSKWIKIGGEIVATGGENYIDLWWKQEGEEVTEGSEQVVIPQYHRSIYLAKVFAPKQNLITNWALSDCGETLVIGTAYDTSVYAIQPRLRKKTAKIVRLAKYDLVATALWVSKRQLLVASGNFQIVEINLRHLKKEPRVVLQQEECGSVVKMEASNSGANLGVLTSRSQCFLINLKNGKSVLAKVDLPTDLIINEEFAYILSGVELSTAQRKVFFEVGLSNGAIKRGVTSNQLKMLPTTPKSTVPGFPISLEKVEEGWAVVYSIDGHWSLIDLKSGQIYNSNDVCFKAKKGKEEIGNCVVGIRKRKIDDNENSALSNRLVVLQVEGDVAPKVDGFKIKKFGMQ